MVDGPWVIRLNSRRTLNGARGRSVEIFVFFPAQILSVFVFDFCVFFLVPSILVSPPPSLFLVFGLCGRQEPSLDGGH